VPSARERLVTGIRGFFSESKPLPAGGAEVQQETTVYRTERAAADALQEILDAKEACDREQESGQVIRGYRRARIPRTVTLDARAVSATMVVQSSGDQFAYRFGCVQRGPVLQCLHTYTITEPVGRRWFNRALTATSRDLSRSGAL
jgi:hypothetical protein